MMSANGPLSSVVPFQSYPTIHKCINEVHSGHISTSLTTEMKYYSVEFAELFHNSIIYQCHDVVTQFAEFIVMHTEEIHQLNHIPPIPTPIPGSYNPPSGSVYYFSKTGEQVANKYYLNNSVYS